MSVIAVIILSMALTGQTQQPRTNLPRIGFLWTGSSQLTTQAVKAFRRGLREVGYIEGQNIAIEHRWAADDLQRLPDLAAELIRAKVDVIVTQGTPAAQAAKRATSTVPIVIAIAGDPVGTGLVSSLAHPGGNVTGLTVSVDGVVLSAKRLELLREVVPRAMRVAVTAFPATASDTG